MKRLLTVLTLVLCLSGQAAHAKVYTKLEAGAIIGQLDILSQGAKQFSLEVGGAQVNSSFVWENGFTIKPAVRAVAGEADAVGVTCAAGWYLPIWKKVAFLPHVGGGWSYMRTDDLDLGGVSGTVKQTYDGTSVFAGTDVVFTLSKNLIVSGNYSYSWNNTLTTLDFNTLTFLNDKSRTSAKGPAYMAQIDYSVNDKWAVSLAGLYQIGREKERNGLRTQGLRLGVAYYF